MEFLLQIKKNFEKYSQHDLYNLFKYYNIDNLCCEFNDKLWLLSLHFEDSQNYYVSNIENKTIKNKNFRQILFTGTNMQLVVMSLKPKEDIGKEIHSNVDQFFRVEQGIGKAILNKKEYALYNGVAIMVPAGVEHNIINTGKKELKLYTIYSPPQHKKGLIQQNKS